MLVTTSSFLNKLPNFAYCVLEIKNVFGEYFWYFGSTAIIICRICLRVH